VTRDNPLPFQALRGFTSLPFLTPSCFMQAVNMCVSVRFCVDARVVHVQCSLNRGIREHWGYSSLQQSTAVYSSLQQSTTVYSVWFKFGC
jgi:hypothetical protein